MTIEIRERVDVDVNLGAPAIATQSFDSALYLADLLDANFAEAYRVYTSYAQVLEDFDVDSATAKFASKVFTGNFKPSKLFVVKYGATNAVPLTPVQALTAQLNAAPDFYYVASDIVDEAAITSLVALCTSQFRMYVNASGAINILDSAVSDDIGSVLQDASYNHVITLYHPSAATEQVAGGIIGAFASIQAGVSTLEDKTLVGVTPTSLTTTQTETLKSKNVGYYSTIAGVNSYFNSKVASGQFLDTIVFSDWLRARLGESIYGVMKGESDRGRKVAYTEAGKLKIRQAIEGVIQRGIAAGSISTDIEPVIRIPTNAEISEANRLSRILPNVVVEVLYTSAVHKVLVKAYVGI